MKDEAEADRQNEEDFVSGKVDFWDKAYFYPVPCPLCGVETRRMVNVPTGRADILAAMTAAHLRRMSKAAEAYLSLHISPPARGKKETVTMPCCSGHDHSNDIIQLALEQCLADQFGVASLWTTREEAGRLVASEQSPTPCRLCGNMTKHRVVMQEQGAKGVRFLIWAVLWVQLEK